MMANQDPASAPILRVTALALMISFAWSATASAQRTGDAPPSAEALAPVDFTGIYVSVVTESWRWRMVTPARNDVVSIPLNEAGLRAADQWNPELDSLRGEACRSYGAAGIMRIPGRVRISWQDTNTLQLDLDAGTQTRLLRFEPDARAMDPGERSLQGHSLAAWETTDGTPDGDLTGSLKIVTTNMRPGYLRKNGVPYSRDTVLTEYFDLTTAPSGETWLVITTIVDDPAYLRRTWVTSPNFRKEADDRGFMPSECSSTW